MSDGGLVVFFEFAILAYFLAINGIYLVFTVVAFLDLLAYRLQVGSGHLRTLLSDNTYRPISILVPAHNEADTVVENVRSLLMLGYPEFEILLINDGSDDATLDLLREAFALYPVPPAFRSDLHTKRVRQVLVSVEHPNLTVLDKERGGKSDALNAGINASRYPLFCTIDADSILESDALLRIARAFAEDERVVAAGGIIRPLNAARVRNGRVQAAPTPLRPLLLCQAQEYVRAFLTGRSSLARFNALLIIAGAFGLFRKDAAVDAGGFSNDTVCEDMELVARLHREAFEAGEEVRVVFIPDPVCWTQVPSDWGSLRRQRDRWQRGLLQCLWKHRVMFLNPRYRQVGLLAMPFYALFEALGPLVELAGYVLLVALLVSGNFDPAFALLFFLLAICYGMLLSIAALNLDDLLFKRYASTSDLAKMMLGAVLEFAGYRQMLVLVRAAAFVTVFLKGDEWGKVERERIGEGADGVGRELPA
jgi:cellulose synthase/poly-beta-1,6-N-acetylglucosamine synthase-like glycosyltransferase